MKYTQIIIIALLLLAINSCKEEDKINQNDRAYTPETIQEEYGSARVVGFVVDKAGNPLDGVSVLFGEHERITDGEGKFELSEVSAGSGKRIWFEKEGYARTQKLVDVREDLPNRVDAALFQIAKTEKINDEGGLIEGEDFSVDIQSGGFVYSDGEIVEGEVIVSVTPFLTSEENFIDAFPGDFEGRREDGSTTPIESFGFIDVDLRDEFGEPVQMADGVTATIRIKAPENAPATIPMWWYDFKKAEWIEEGTGSLENGFYTAEVTHFTPWNWDRPLPNPPQPSTIIGRVVDNGGNPIEGARIVQTGINRTFQETTKSEEDGTFEMSTLENMDIELEAQFDIYGSTVLEKTTSSNQGEINNFGDIIIDVSINNIITPYIDSDKLYITMGDTVKIRGKYFGEEKREVYKLLLNGEEIETINWQGNLIEFLVPNGIPPEGMIQIDRGGTFSKVIKYNEGEWTCEIDGVVYDNNNLPISNKKIILNLEGQYLDQIPSCIGNLQNLELLFLEKNRLINLPESISNLQILNELNLSTNKLVELPESIGNLQNLTSLKLEHNQLINLPESIGNLQNLEELSLKNNNFSDLPESIGNLQNLISLVLDDNQLINLPESIGNLQNLKRFFLNLNQISKLPDKIYNLQNLEELSLTSNNFSNLPESIGNLQNLVDISLYKNQLSNLPESIGNLENLRMLSVHENQLNNLPESIGTLQNLSMLQLSINQLTKLPESIGTLHNLIGLNLQENQLTKLPESIGNLTNLSYIDLKNNKLESLPESIRNLKDNLNRLTLEGNNFSEEERAKIEEWLPNTYIEW